MKTSAIHSLLTLIVASLFTFSLSFLNPCAAQSPVLYGMTEGGGTMSNGTIFRFDPVTNTDSTVWNFVGGTTDGRNPNGSLVYNANNNLFYATTSSGGTLSDGTIISFNPITGAESLVWSFKGGAAGADPTGNLVYYAGNGSFYGMTRRYGGNNKGAIFRFDPAADTVGVVWNFGAGTDGASPGGSLMYDSATGLLYAMTAGGGANSVGAIISFNPATNTDSVLYSFKGGATDGELPLGNLVYNAGNGLLYGMTANGGTANLGTIISFNTTTGTDSLLWSFGTGTDGMRPDGDLAYDAGNGSFYGTATRGGTNNYGTIFSFDPVADTEQVVWNFGSGTDGKLPTTNVVLDASNGLFYGLIGSGGSVNGIAGVLFSFNPATDTEQVVWNFGSGTDGELPLGNPVLYSGPAPLLAVASSNNITCNNLCNGSASVAALQGAPPYHYLWAPGGQTTDTVQGLCTGTYIVAVTDTLNNTVSDTIIITAPAAPLATITASDTLLVNSDSAVLCVTPSFPHYQWNFSGDTTACITTYNTGMYYAAVTDTNNCTWTSDSIIISACPVQAVSLTVQTVNDTPVVSVTGNTCPVNILWYFNDSLISNIDSFYANHVLGTYTIKAVTDSTCCGGGGNYFWFDVNTGITGIATLAEAKNISLSPNPTTGQFTIAGISSGQTVEIYNYLGQLVSRILPKSLNTPEVSKEQLDISSQPNGIYLIQVSGKDGIRVSEQKVVKIN